MACRRQGVRSFVLLTVLGVLVAACGGDNDRDLAAVEPVTQPDVADAGDPVHGGSITVGLEAETNSWLPGAGNFSNPGINVALAIYDPLLRRDETGEMRPYLAESFEVNDELTEWTVTLRPGVQFHDGTPLDAEAVKTVFDTHIKADGSNLAGMVDDVVSVDVIDEHTVLYRLAEANAAFDGVLAGAVGWIFSPTAATAAGEDAGSVPAGTGPFVFDSWQRDSRVVVKRNPDYWQEGLPYLDEIVFRPIPDEDTRLSSLSAGDIDVLQSLRQSTIRRARDLGGIDSYEHLGNNTGSAIFNTSRAPFDDVRVRRALAYALDQDQLVEVLGGTGLTPPHTQYFAESSPWYSEAAAEAWPTNDPAQAQQLLDEYVNDPARSDGEPGGSPVSFQFDCPPDPGLIELSQLYQAFWQMVGAEVKLKQVEQATHISQGLSGDFDAKCWRVGSQSDPYSELRDAFTEGNMLNFTRFTDPRIDEALEVLRTTRDVAPRKEAVEEISLVIAQQVPNTFTAGTLTTLAARSEVKNLNGWTFPDGTLGEGVPGATAMWGHVWVTG
jgi:peptide/nickel transport system substrate-binding protein